ncbi:DUF1566 domain-containing protein [Algiphilus sp.]|uniref:Lcl C-terminal domain-containing protein n=1 Tax=Algiphilus sp. TaxID=1872431 RepID=UPI0025C0DB3D|nr:DUF1566 domain-containing protein [Algiphilus sp.]MCK5770904.1 DUF1566 domain-containing protein [Algiphilus sp.]
MQLSISIERTGPDGLSIHIPDLAELTASDAPQPASQLPSSRYRLLDAGGQPTRDTPVLVHDTTTNLIWTAADSITRDRVNHTRATEAARSLRYMGADDWRLPTMHELLSIVDYGRHEPAIDTAAFRCHARPYWSSSLFAGDSGFAWFVGFHYGGASVCSRDVDSAFVRAVRGPVRAASQ